MKCALRLFAFLYDRRLPKQKGALVRLDRRALCTRFPQESKRTALWHRRGNKSGYFAAIDCESERIKLGNCRRGNAFAIRTLTPLRD
jgi:hypothetical protein